ncbi:MAG TPA: hypothetical protein VGF79_16565 [Bacteroidia bacterium]
MSDSDNLQQYAIDSTKQLFAVDSLPLDTQQIIIWLEDKVYELLNKDFNALVNLLYRIDVYESKAKQCFGKENREIAKCLAQLIWDRQMEKAQRKYSGL